MMSSKPVNISDAQLDKMVTKMRNGRELPGVGFVKMNYHDIRSYFKRKFDWDFDYFEMRMGKL